jgi:hypothetical protein
MKMKSLLLLLGLAGFAGCTSVQSRIEIEAPVEKVRAVLFKFDDYPAWNPFIVKIDGTVAVGQAVTVTVRPVGKAEISGTTAVLALEPDRLVWRGSLAIPGIFSGVHEFRLEAAGPNRTVFTNNESMSGAIIPFYDFKPTAAGFAAMNAALKQRAEAR